MNDLNALIQAVLKSPKYHALCPTVVQTIAQRELAKGRRGKEVVKATKNKLHQIAGACLDGKMRYDVWLRDLQHAAKSQDQAQFRHTCQAIMGHHASTAERLSILDEFYPTLFAALPPIHSILDLACGLNPLSLPWMPIVPDIRYYAYDIYEDMMNFLLAYFSLSGIIGQAQTCDLLTEVPNDSVDLALVLKVLPCLAQVQAGAGLRLLRDIRARYLLVSFPVLSLGGRDKGMRQGYECQFLAAIADEGWQVERFVFETELVFLVEKFSPLA